MMEESRKKPKRLVKLIDFGGGIFGKIYLRYDITSQSTHTYLEREFRCYVCSSSVDHYLTSFDTMRKAKLYLLKLYSHRYKE